MSKPSNPQPSKAAPKRAGRQTDKVNASPLLTDLPDTLAQRVQVLRTRRNYTVAELAERGRVTIEDIEAIEGGIQLFLPILMRQKLARVLRISPAVLAAVEKIPDFEPATALNTDTGLELPASTEESRSLLLFKISQNPTKDFTCPDCSSPLKVRRFLRRDVNDDPIEALKIHCTQCLFRLEQN